MKRPAIDARARAHPAYWAFVVHRLSGLLLAGFLPLHFALLAQAVRGQAGFDGWLRLVDMPMFKIAEWGLVVLLSLHLVGGTRLLLIEFGRWNGPRKDWIAGSIGFAAATGLAYALALLA